MGFIGIRLIESNLLSFMKKHFLPVVLTAFAALSGAAVASAKSSQPVQALQQAAGVWIDVRTPAEFAAGRLRHAVNIPVHEIVGRIQSVSPDKNTPIHLYCRSGSRADAALRALEQMGYKHVVNHGGYQDLLNKGMR